MMTDKAEHALNEIAKYNPIRNDREMYFAELILWARGEIEEKPLPHWFGLGEPNE